MNVAAVKVERNNLYINFESEDHVDELIALKRNGKREINFETVNGDKSHYRVDLALFSKSEYYNIYAKKNGISKRVGKNLYKSVSNSKERILAYKAIEKSAKKLHAI